MSYNRIEPDEFEKKLHKILNNEEKEKDNNLDKIGINRERIIAMIVNSSRFQNLIDMCFDANVDDVHIGENSPDMFVDIHDYAIDTIEHNDWVSVRIFSYLNQSLINIIWDYTINHSLYDVIVYTRDVKDTEIFKWYCDIKKPNKKEYSVFAHIFPTLKTDDDQLEFSKYIYNTFKLSPEDCKCIDIYSLSYACNHGRIKVANWLIELFGKDYYEEDICKVVFEACRKGNIETVEWLINTFVPIRGDCFNLHVPEDLLDVACSHNHLHLVKWLIVKFEITKKDYMDVYFVFESACINNRTDIVKWLVEEFKLDKEICLNPSLYSDGKSAFAIICEKSTVDIVKYICTTFKLTRDDILKSNVVLDLCSHNVRTWLVEEYKMCNSL